ncbi:hypothetical protein CEXT_187101, partial [Caerostris extrusa]
MGGGNTAVRSQRQMAEEERGKELRLKTKFRLVAG